MNLSKAKKNIGGFVLIDTSIKEAYYTLYAVCQIVCYTPVHQIVHHFCKRYGDLWRFMSFALPFAILYFLLKGIK